MSLMEQVVTALRTKYKVSTVLLSKQEYKQIYVLLDKYDPKRETPTSYTPYISYNIVFYETNSLTIEDTITDIIQTVSDAVNLTHMNFSDVSINPTNNDVEVVISLQFYKVIEFG